MSHGHLAKFENSDAIAEEHQLFNHSICNPFKILSYLHFCLSMNVAAVGRSISLALADSWSHAQFVLPSHARPIPLERANKSTLFSNSSTILLLVTRCQFIFPAVIDLFVTPPNLSPLNLTEAFPVSGYLISN